MRIKLSLSLSLSLPSFFTPPPTHTLSHSGQERKSSSGGVLLFFCLFPMFSPAQTDQPGRVSFSTPTPAIVPSSPSCKRVTLLKSKKGSATSTRSPPGVARPLSRPTPFKLAAGAWMPGPPKALFVAATMVLAPPAALAPPPPPQPPLVSLLSLTLRKLTVSMARWPWCGTMGGFM